MSKEELKQLLTSTFHIKQLDANLHVKKRPEEYMLRKKKRGVLKINYSDVTASQSEFPSPLDMMTMLNCAPSTQKSTGLFNFSLSIQYHTHSLELVGEKEECPKFYSSMEMVAALPLA